MSLLHVSVFDHNQGVCPEPGCSYIYIKTFGEIMSLFIMQLCGSMLGHNRLINKNVISLNVLISIQLQPGSAQAP